MKEVITAYLLDLIIGDPYWLPHPVRMIGKFIEYLEKALRKNNDQNQRTEKIKGIILTVITVGLSYYIIYFLIYIAGVISPGLKFAFSSFFIFTTLSTKNLGEEAFSVYRALEEDNLELAREKVSRIVGRDTKGLSRDEIVRATVETVAENTVDGIISPLFYAVLGGAPLAMAYKVVNTLDSMVGYKNEKYIQFGWFSAKLDDLVNYLPARISVLLIPMASLLVRQRGLMALRIIFRDGKKSPSPNAGIPEAGFAGALGIQLGGVNFYQGVKEYRPILGEKLKEISLKDILKAIWLSCTVSILMFLIGLVLLCFGGQVLQ
ncbi:cobalamin biosynthesis protein CobD [Candidatus Atribacteria bacterium HGW-Atribacteria-1]|nr:MAG: cobalamin biosynthesis protein CobD [Candidatus Atribacteria bacterium HGW-Atribacteria-1]